ncbi:MAG TPA: sigma-70 family RNA polymerase sigma factor [Povalibacter sp.]|nr:sigma-70 family RNA polymerase sigma factor [Povalibacter sp.]
MSQFQGVQIPPEVISAAAAGDMAAHDAIYRACGRAVYTLIRRLIPQAAADDLFQEVFVEIMRSARSYSGEGSFAGWVRSIAVNKCLTYLRSPWQRRALWLDAQEEESSALVLVDAAPHPDVQAVASADLERAFATLPALTRSVVWLHDVEGYTHHEIAHLLGRTPSFSKSQLSRAHLRLRELLDPQVPASNVESLPCTPVSTSC